MRKTNKTAIAYILTAACIFAAGALIQYIFTASAWDIGFGSAGRGATRFNFEIGGGNGFARKVTVYTEDGITSVDFSGKITIDGTAGISIVSNENGAVVYSKSYTDIKAEKLNFTADGLEPYSYYTLEFSSANAKKGSLILTTNHSLVERPEPPPKLREKNNK